MHRIILLTCIPLLLSGKLCAQNGSKDIDYYDQKTYEQFIHNEWKELIRTGKEASRINVDFYYLHLRMGVAYYELERFRDAASCFSRALEYYPEDTLVLEYYYYSLLFSGTSQEADLLCYKNNDLLKYRIKEEHILSYKETFVESGFSFGDNLQKNSKTDIDGVDNQLGEAELIDNAEYYALGFRHSFWPRLHLTYALSYISTGRIFRVQRQDVDIVYSRQDISQNQLYCKGDFLLPWKFNFSLAYNNVLVDHNKYVNRGNIIAPDYQLVDYYYDHEVFSLALYRDLWKFKFRASYTQGNLNKQSQEQINFGMELYPFGNLHLYSVSDIYSHKNANNSEWLMNQKIGCRIWKKIWWEAYATFGKSSNFIEDNAYITYNTGKEVAFKWGSNLFFRIRPDIELRLYFKNVFFEDTYYRFEDLLPVPQGINYTYKTYLITGGLKWMF
jgi:hypothetical protein